MSKTKKHPLRPAEDDPFYDIQQAASMTECTGILPAQIGTDEEAESIAALESVHPVQPSSLIREKHP